VDKEEGRLLRRLDEGDRECPEKAAGKEGSRICGSVERDERGAGMRQETKCQGWFRGKSPDGTSDFPNVQELNGLNISKRCRFGIQNVPKTEDGVKFDNTDQVFWVKEEELIDGVNFLIANSCVRILCKTFAIKT
jgi:hypothetical protein